MYIVYIYVYIYICYYYSSYSVALFSAKPTIFAVFESSCLSEGAKGMLMRQLTRCLRKGSFGLRAGIVFGDAGAGIRTPGFCFRGVFIASPLLKMNSWVLNIVLPCFAHYTYGRMRTIFKARNRSQQNKKTFVLVIPCAALIFGVTSRLNHYALP